ncbi:MAG: hypothetical protein QNJ54_16395 [Prochloraceae cyanobacterium]|nr:hypothetical protein [Prochloraceae cyanobacterium]
MKNDQYYIDLLEVITKPLGINDFLNEVCNKIEDELKCDFAAIQLIDREKSIIEAVSGGGGAAWVGLSRHYLEKNKKLRDIQADIAFTCQTEIIAGYEDPRFDRGIFKQFCHKSMHRIFTPIFLIKNKYGKLYKTWFDNLTEAKFLKDVKGSDDEHKFLKNGSKESENCYKKIFKIDVSKLSLDKDVSFKEDEELVVEVIGTVEVGYNNPLDSIKIDKAEKLIQLVSKEAVIIHEEYLFSSVLIKLASILQVKANAQGSSLFFNIECIKNPYCHKIENNEIKEYLEKVEKNLIPYNYSSDNNGSDDSNHYPFRFGEGNFINKVITDKKVRYEKYKSSREEDVGIAVFPLIYEEENEKKVHFILSLYFQKQDSFDQNISENLSKLLNRTFEVIKQMIIFKKNETQYNQLLAFKTGFETFLVTNLDKKGLLGYIAGNTLNLLAADIVMIYEYININKAQNVFPCERNIAGKLKSKNKDQLHIESKELDKIIKDNFTNDEENSITYLKELEDKGIIEHLKENEEIHSSYVLLLKRKYKPEKYKAREVFGVMFINYRRPYKFSKNEKKFVEELSNLAAIAIYDQQLALGTARNKFTNYADEFDRAFKNAYKNEGLDDQDKRNEFASNFANHLENKKQVD